MHVRIVAFLFPINKKLHLIAARTVFLSFTGRLAPRFGSVDASKAHLIALPLLFLQWRTLETGVSLGHEEGWRFTRDLAYELVAWNVFL